MKFDFSSPLFPKSSLLLFLCVSVVNPLLLGDKK
jgi:hypothetical protein